VRNSFLGVAPWVHHIPTKKNIYLKKKLFPHLNHIIQERFYHSDSKSSITIIIKIINGEGFWWWYLMEHIHNN
jgi:hypothetical protein